jgi:hypothetical protein
MMNWNASVSTTGSMGIRGDIAIGRDTRRARIGFEIMAIGNQRLEPRSEGG